MGYHRLASNKPRGCIHYICCCWDEVDLWYRMIIKERVCLYLCIDKMRYLFSSSSRVIWWWSRRNKLPHVHKHGALFVLRAPTRSLCFSPQNPRKFLFVRRNNFWREVLRLRRIQNTFTFTNNYTHLHALQQSSLPLSDHPEVLTIHTQFTVTGPTNTKSWRHVENRERNYSGIIRYDE